jgi:hypothetical protein
VVVWYLSMILHFIQKKYTNDSLSMLRLCLVMEEVVSEKVFPRMLRSIGDTYYWSSGGARSVEG